MRGMLIVFATTLTLWLVSIGCCRGCGLDWTVPKSHFKNVDYRGYVYIVEDLGSLKVSDQFTMPLLITFNSKREVPSPHLGYGWEFPLLDAKMLQADENSFELYQPDGRFRQFSRDSKNPHILNGQGGFKGEIRGDLINIWGACGTKLTFEKGKILSFESKGSNVEYVYQGGALRELRSGPITLLRVERDTADANVTGLVLDDGTRIQTNHAQRPKVNLIEGRILVDGVINSLTSVITPTRVLSFEHGLDDKMNPFLKTDRETVTWNATRHITAETGAEFQWTYVVAPGKSRHSPASIARTNAKGQQESISRDDARGSTSIQRIDGTKITINRFTTGLLNGRLRSVIQTKSGISKIIQQCTYDAKGQLIRQVVHGTKPHTYLYSYDERGKQTEVKMDGKPYCLKEYDKLGRLAVKTMVGGVKTLYSYEEDRITAQALRPDGTTLTRYLDKRFKQIATLGSNDEE